MLMCLHKSDTPISMETIIYNTILERKFFFVSDFAKHFDTWRILFRTLVRFNVVQDSLLPGKNIFWLGVKHKYTKNSCERNSVQLDVSQTKVFQNDAVLFGSFSPHIRITAIKHQFGQQEIK